MPPSRTSRKVSRKTSRKSKRVSRKSRKTSRKSRKTSRKSKRVSRKSSGSSRKSGCVRQTRKKYLNRQSPSYPANKCCNEEIEGNDGNMYVSKRDKNGVCKWVKIK